MASNINYISINENFPIAGQDNDTQVFRDNFNTIKTSFQSAKTEITDLQTYTAKTNQVNDYNGFVSKNTILQNVRQQSQLLGELPLIGSSLGYVEIDYSLASYQTVVFRADTPILFSNLPTASFGSLILEMYSNAENRTISFTTTGGTVIKSIGSFTYPIVISAANTQSSGNARFIEVWRRGPGYIYVRDLGTASTVA
jgi:hypothetical protein